MIWKRVILSWMTVLTLVFASAGATARSDVNLKPHVGAIDQAATICIEAHGLASAEGHRGIWDAVTTETSDVPPAASGGGKRFTSEQQALVDMAKGDKKAGGLTTGDMKAYKDLNKEAGARGFTDKGAVRGPEKHPLRSPNSKPGPGQKSHGHVGPVKHIPVKDVP